MNRKGQILIVFFTVFVLGTLLCVGTGCDAILPDDFQHEEFAAADIDVRAHTLLSRTVQRNEITKQIILDSLTRMVAARTLRSFVDSATRATNTDNQIIHPRFAMLDDSLRPGLVKDSVTLVVYPRAEQVCYSVLEVGNGQAGDIYLYTSLENNARNTKEYVSVQLVRSDTSFVNFSNAAPMEIASESIERVPFTGGSGLVPIIKARYRYHLDQGVYLVKFTLSDPASLVDQTLPRLAPVFFKILIFPI